MSEHMLVGRIVSHLIDSERAAAPMGKAVLEWTTTHATWLTGAEKPKGKGWAWLRKAAAIAAGDARPPHRDAVIATALAGQLGLAPFDARLLEAVLVCERSRIVRSLVRAAALAGADIPVVLGTIAGSPNGGRAVRASPLMGLGLLETQIDHMEGLRITLNWRFEKLLDRGIEDAGRILDALIGTPQPAVLPVEAFAHLGTAPRLLADLLAGAIRERAAGVNILIHGPPGTGKTEFARTLADMAGLKLIDICEADEDGEEPTRYERLAALRLGQRAFAPRGDTVLLFDEFEDMIGDAASEGDDWIREREGSKIFVNRLLERNALPVIWTTNTIANVDPAILRRMSFVLRMDRPSVNAARAMLARIATDEAVALDGRLEDLVVRAPQTASVLRTALRTGKLTGSGEAAALASAESLVAALTRRPALSELDPDAFDPSLVEIDSDLPVLIDRLASDATPRDFSLLLTGAPGTGKTGLARHVAERLDRPLIVKRASDLMSKWVGETEQNIAEAFAEARAAEAVLLFDEIDSLLADRSTARASWEVSQVNELLTWFERHPLPFIAATNFAARLDPAALRRFVFKLELKPLSGTRAGAAFERFFGVPAPAGLGRVHGITPGDLAVVRRQCRFAVGSPDPAAIVAMIEREVKFRPETGGRMGF